MCVLALSVLHIRRLGVVGIIPAFQPRGPGLIPGGVSNFNFSTFWSNMRSKVRLKWGLRSHSFSSKIGTRIIGLKLILIKEDWPGMSLKTSDTNSLLALRHHSAFMTYSTKKRPKKESFLKRRTEESSSRGMGEINPETCQGLDKSMKNRWKALKKAKSYDSSHWI